MNKIQLASELVKIAKSLSATSLFDLNKAKESLDAINSFIEETAGEASNFEFSKHKQSDLLRIKNFLDGFVYDVKNTNTQIERLLVIYSKNRDLLK